MLRAAGAYLQGFDPATFSLPGVVPDGVAWEAYEGWTAGLVRRALGQRR